MEDYIKTAHENLFEIIKKTIADERLKDETKVMVIERLMLKTRITITNKIIETTDSLLNQASL